MLPLSFQEIIYATKAKLFRPTTLPQRIKGVSTDTRTIEPGEVFVALTGPRYDGHSFINEAVQRGAAGVIAKQPPRRFNKHLKRIPILCVRNTIKALGQLASYYRTKLSLPIIAVTGSNGKTTTKEMIYHILSAGRPGIRSKKSYNNFIGVPLTILSIRPRHQFAVLELGTNYRGELPYLAQIVKANIGVITNISATHLQGLGSIRNVAYEKWSLFKHLSPGGTALFNMDDPWLKKMPKYAEYKVVTFGASNRVDIRGINLKLNRKGISFTVNNRFFCQLSVSGSWNMENALAAMATTSVLGVKLRNATNRLRNFKSPPMRMETQIIRGTTFINDAYNANPRSVTLAIDELDHLPTQGRKILVLGDMYELGKCSRKFHASLGNQIRQTDIDTILTIGQAVRYTIAQLNKLNTRQMLFHFNSATTAGDFLKNYIKPGDLVLLKGSRVMELEKVLEPLSKERT